MSGKKMVLIVLLALILTIATPATGTTSETLEPLIPQDGLSGLELDEMNRLLAEIDKELEQYMPEVSFKNALQSMLAGSFTLSTQDFLQGLLNVFKQEVALNLNVIGKLLFLAVLSALIMNLQSAFEKGSVSRIANFIILAIVIILILSSVNQVLTLGQSAISRMSGFMQVLLPIQLVLLVALGGVSSVAILQPSLFFMINMMGSLLTYIIFPLIYFEVVLKMVNQLSSEFKVDKLAGLFKSMILYIISISSTLFLALLSIQGVGGAVMDGLSIRTVKHVAGAFVPVVGGMIADVMDTVVGGSLLVKNSFGILGLLVLLVITLVPAIKLFVIYLMYKFAAALVQPLGDSKVVGIVNDLANSLLLVFAAVVFVGVMFFFTIVILTTTANFSVMLR